MGRDAEHPGDTQIRTWIPDDQYAVIREMAAARQVSVSQIVRELIARGMEQDAGAASVRQVLTALDHLERLVFFAAQQAAVAATWDQEGYRSATRQKLPDDPDRAAALAEQMIGKMQGIAHERLRKALRGPNPVRKEVRNASGADPDPE
jgi:hypothetical protein